MIDRRTLLATLAGAGLLGFLPDGVHADHNGSDLSPILSSATDFSKQQLLQQVRKLAQTKYVAPKTVPQQWMNLSYDQYKSINYRRDAALWHHTKRLYEIEFFAPGMRFPSPVQVFMVEKAKAYQVQFSQQQFDYRQSLPELPDDPALGYSGFRLRSTINDPIRKDEFVVFQGASYFRAIGRDQVYGLSARGLAINTADQGTEEFPDFRAFWIEAAEPGARTITLHALLDSPSVAGLYTFRITPGTSTEMNVNAHLFPRQTLKHVGIGAATSMFLFDQTNRHRFDDFRPSVHDSDGLLIENGAGETLWRPLANPSKLQISQFIDHNPRGFGLMQRPRQLSDFADLEAHYHKRPGLWVIPGEDWGAGSVSLVEIPADQEIYDNIVAYWRPSEPIPQGEEFRFSYRLFWCVQPPHGQTLARVINTRIGKKASGGKITTIDFAPADALPMELDQISVDISSNVGSVAFDALQHNPSTQGVRLAFNFDPGKHLSMELRVQLYARDRPVSEVWLYRWTA